MDTAALLIIEVLNGIASLALACAGLAIIFGMMRVINFAHGEFMMLGAYTYKGTHFSRSALSQGNDLVRVLREGDFD